MKRSQLPLLLAIALTLVALPALAADLPSTSCAYAGPASLSPAAPTAEPIPELFGAPLEVHLGALDPLDPEMGAAKARALEAMGFSGGEVVSDQQDCYIFTSSEQCGPWYRTGDCCSNPEANREAKRCTYNGVCDGVSSLITIIYYNCVGTICY